VRQRVRRVKLAKSQLKTELPRAHDARPARPRQRVEPSVWSVETEHKSRATERVRNVRKAISRIPTVTDCVCRAYPASTQLFLQRRIAYRVARVQTDTTAQIAQQVLAVGRVCHVLHVVRTILTWDA
jgi:hypothetical protein